MSTAADLVQRFNSAMAMGDFATAHGCLGHDFSFRGPIDQFNAPEPYLDALKKLHPIIERIEMKKTFVDGSDVCVLYDMVTKTPIGTAFVAEWFTVAGGKIRSIRTVFDARPFAAMFGK
jgi:hypothetical protein